MSVAAKLPVTIADRYKLGPGIVRIPATWEEYVELLAEADYQLEYEQNEIILMSIATNPHEKIVANILAILNRLFDKMPDIMELGSNRHIYLIEFECDYAPDAHVVKGIPEEYTLRKGLTANLNPYIIFEVLSKSTRGHDLGNKLPRYKKIPTVKQIIYLEQSYPFVSVFNRIGNTSEWKNIDYDDAKQSFSIEGKKVKVGDFYKKVIFPAMD